MVRALAAAIVAVWACTIGPARADGCLEFSKIDLVRAGFEALHGQPMDTAAVQADCKVIITAEPERQDARYQLARAEIAAAAFAQADKELAWLDAHKHAAAIRIRGFLIDLNLPGKPRDLALAQGYYIRAIALGDVIALDMRARGLAETAINGNTPIPPEAIELLDRAVEKGYPGAMSDLASYLDDGSVPGRTVDECFKLVTAAADKGSLPAMLQLSRYYALGIGTPKDRKLAEDWARKALSYTPAVLALPDGFGDYPVPAG